MGSLLKRRSATSLVMASLTAVCLLLVFFRLSALDFQTAYLLPERVWDLEITQRVDADGEDIELAVFLPQSGQRQTVREQSHRSPGFEFEATQEGENLRGRWRSLGGEANPREVVFQATLHTQALRVEIDPALKIPEQPRDVDPSLIGATRDIQTDAPDIVALAERLMPEDRSLVGFLRAAFDHVQGFGFRPFKGTTSALTALRLEEASCNGRSRLLVALMRSQKIPARLVGGLIMTEGKKRTSHQWVEARIEGRWVPFDALNHHFASLPAHYVSLYRGDHNLFRHSAAIAFDYGFTLRSRLVPPTTIAERRGTLGLWAIFSDLGIPLELMRLLLMIPIGAMVIVVFRNVVGLKTFGTFLPTLIAAASFNTGFWWGALGFVTIILLTAQVRRLIGPLQLLHSPQLAILLTATVSLMIALTYLGSLSGALGLTRITLFPIAVLAITSERYVLMEIEEGRFEAFTTLLTTLVVVFFCYIVMRSVALQLLFMAFPELLLLIVAVDIYLGRWLGVRVTEWARFKSLLPGAPV